MPIDALPQALMFDQPAIIVPPPSEIRRDDAAWMSLVNEEAAFGNEELESSWQVFAKSPNGSFWMMRAKDMGKGSDLKSTVRIKVDHRNDNIIRGGYGLQLLRVNCKTRESAALIRSLYDNDGKQYSHTISEAPIMGKTFEQSPGRLAVETFCERE